MKKIVFCLVAASLAFVLFAIVLTGCFRPGFLRAQPNDGHQLGGDCFAAILGNTIESFVKAIEEIEDQETYQYSEFDVRETSDGQLIVFHDWDVSRIPDTPANRQVLGGAVQDQAICDLTLAQIQQLDLGGGVTAPTLEQVLETAEKIRPSKPILVEIKFLQTDAARQQLLDSVKRFRDRSGLEIHFLAFIRNINRSFPNPDAWLQRISNAGFRVYQVYRPKTDQYDLCRTFS